MFARIRAGFFPAVPVLVDAQGRLAVEATQAYINWLMGHAVDGVAIWAHTGRGLYLKRDDRKLVAELWASRMQGRILICGVGSASAQTEKELVQQSVEMAVQAKEWGAQALLVYPPRILQTPRSIVAYHREIAQVGLPVIAFHLYEEAGGRPYTDSVIRGILGIPEVVGIKVATLDSIMRFQEIAAVMREFPEKALITGEDRMLGYTFTRGASGALVGLGAVETDLQLKLVAAWRQKDYANFIRYQQIVDDLGEAIFREPIEGYVGRLLYVLARRGIIPYSAACDPWGPKLTKQEQRLIDSCLALVDVFRGEKVN